MYSGEKTMSPVMRQHHVIITSAVICLALLATTLALFLGLAGTRTTGSEDYNDHSADTVVTSDFGGSPAAEQHGNSTAGLDIGDDTEREAALSNPMDLASNHPLASPVEWRTKGGIRLEFVDYPRGRPLILRPEAVLFDDNMVQLGSDTFRTCVNDGGLIMEFTGSLRTASKQIFLFFADGQYYVPPVVFENTIFESSQVVDKESYLVPLDFEDHDIIAKYLPLESPYWSPLMVAYIKPKLWPLESKSDYSGSSYTLVRIQCIRLGFLDLAGANSTLIYYPETHQNSPHAIRGMTSGYISHVLNQSSTLYGVSRVHDNVLPLLPGIYTAQGVGPEGEYFWAPHLEILSGETLKPPESSSLITELPTAMEITPSSVSRFGLIAGYNVRISDPSTSERFSFGIPIVAAEKENGQYHLSKDLLAPGRLYATGILTLSAPLKGGVAILAGIASGKLCEISAYDKNGVLNIPPLKVSLLPGEYLQVTYPPAPVECRVEITVPSDYPSKTFDLHVTAHVEGASPMIYQIDGYAKTIQIYPGRYLATLHQGEFPVERKWLIVPANAQSCRLDFAIGKRTRRDWIVRVEGESDLIPRELPFFPQRRGSAAPPAGIEVQSIKGSGMLSWGLEDGEYWLQSFAPPVIVNLGPYFIQSESEQMVDEVVLRHAEEWLRVVDRNTGKPIHRVTIETNTVRSLERSAPLGSMGLTGGITDEAGEARLPILLHDGMEPLAHRIWHRDYVGVNLRADFSKPPREARVVTLIPRGRVLEVMVEGPDGEPIAGATVDARAVSSETARSEVSVWAYPRPTDRFGFARIEDAPDGALRVRVTPDSSIFTSKRFKETTITLEDEDIRVGEVVVVRLEEERVDGE
jgi:hypothetical protein